MQEQTQHKTETQQAAGFSDAAKQMGSETKTMHAPSLYPDLSSPKQLQEMANKSKKVAQLKETQQSINTNNQAPEALKVVQAMFVNKKDGKQISTLQDLNTELTTLNSLQPFTNLTLADFPSAQSLADLDNAIKYCSTVVKEGINVQAQIIDFVEGIIASMSQSTNGTGSTTTRAGSGAAAAAAAATTTTAGTSKTLTAFKFDEPSTWDVQPVDTSRINKSLDELGLTQSAKDALISASLNDRHGRGQPVIDTDYHEHAIGGSGGIAFRYVREKGTCKVTPTIYNYAEKRSGESNNDYHWKDAGKSSGPPGFPG